MDFIYYLLIIAGAIMVYRTDNLLKKVKLENSFKAIIGLKFAGLGIAVVGMLFIMKVF